MTKNAGDGTPTKAHEYVEVYKTYITQRKMGAAFAGNMVLTMLYQRIEPMSQERGGSDQAVLGVLYELDQLWRAIVSRLNSMAGKRSKVVHDPAAFEDLITKATPEVARAWAADRAQRKEARAARQRGGH